MITPFPSPLPLVAAFAVAAAPAPTPGPTPAPTVDWTGVDAPIDTTLWASTFYKDLTGTALCTASLDDVGSIRHPVTNALIWVAPSLTAAWRLNIISGVPYLEPKSTAADSLLEFTKGSSSQYFNWGVAVRVLSIINNGRILRRSTAGGGFYLNTYTGGGVSCYNNGSVDFKDTGATAGTGRVLDGYIGDGSSTPQAWARFRVNGSNVLLSDGSPPSNVSPGATQANGIMLGGKGTAGFNGFSADCRIRAAYFHQGTNNATMLSQAKVDEINTWMQSLTI